MRITAIYDQKALENLVRRDAERMGRKIVKGTLKVGPKFVRRSKGGPDEMQGVRARYEYAALCIKRTKRGVRGD